MVQLPQILPRFVPLGPPDESQFILLEQAVAARLPELFGGFDVLHWTTFRITRDSDIELLEQESDDMLRLIEERLQGAAARGTPCAWKSPTGASGELMQQDRRPKRSLREAAENAADPYSEVVPHPGPTGSDRMMELIEIPNRDYLAQRAVFTATAAGLGVRGGRGPVHGDCPARHPGAPSVRFVRPGGRVRQPRPPRIPMCWPSSKRCIASAAIRRSRGP